MFAEYFLRVAAFIAISCISFSSQALEGGENGFDVMVMFRPGVAEIPGGISAARPAEVRFSQSRIGEILFQCNAQYILRAVPDFQRADTLQVTRTGEIVRVTDWSDTYIIKLNNSSDANSVSELLNDLPEVMYAGLLLQRPFSFVFLIS